MNSSTLPLRRKLATFLRWAFPPPPYRSPPTASRRPSDKAINPRIIIEWVDSASVNGGLWVSKEEIAPSVMTKAGLTQRTVGFLINQSDDVYLLAQSIGSDRLGAVLAIPKVSVVAMEGWA